MSSPPRGGIGGKLERNEWVLTIDSDLAITVAVAGGQEGLGLLVGECSGRGAEVLQEEPVECRWGEVQTSLHARSPLFNSCKVCFSLQLLLLNEAAVVLVDDEEGLLHFIGALAGQAACLEECLVLEGVGS